MKPFACPYLNATCHGAACGNFNETILAETRLNIAAAKRREDNKARRQRDRRAKAVRTAQKNARKWGRGRRAK